MTNKIRTSLRETKQSLIMFLEKIASFLAITASIKTRMKKLIPFITIFISQFAVAQVSVPDTDSYPHKSIHQEQSEKYAKFNFTTNEQWDSLRFYESGRVSPAAFEGGHKSSSRSCTLNKRVYGWHPYWSNGLEVNYDWSGLTDLCYFSYDVNSATGAATSTHGWSTATVVTTAQANGVNVELCATLFSGHTAFFASTTSQNTLISNLISLVSARGAHGVNIDFEGMGSSNKAGFTAFMINLCNQMHTAIPGSEVSIALYSVDWGGVFDMPALNPYVDQFIIMGYDYYYSGITTAGPEDPLYNFQTGYNYTLTKSIAYYLKQGASRSKLLLGLPYYGREWSTAAATAPSSTTGSSNTVIFNTFKANASGYYGSRHWETNSFSSWYPSVRAGTNWQCWVDDASSMSKRFDVVNQQGIGGIGIWALGYDDGYNDFWNLIQNKFTNCAVVPCTDTIYDMGGPNRNYNDNDSYTYTIAPSGATGVTLNFSSFSTEVNYDSLWIYNGPSTASPLIGAYNGTASPGTVSSTTGAMTIRFKADGSTNSSGFQAIWNCSVDAIAPTTTVSAPTGWATTNFTATFTDADAGGSGIEKSFYNVNDYNGTEWRANNGNGFFNDAFDVAIHPDWTQQVGTWAISTGYLDQSDQTNANTNIWAPLTQNLSNRYLYNWQGKINGTGTNRRAGFHFFCDNATLSNRGNSYFVWFRVDGSVCEFYKVVSNVFTFEYSVPMTVVANQWYDYKVLYDRISGKMDVYQDNNFVGSWTDPSPYSTGSYISFRSGNSDYEVNDLKVFRSRLPSVTVSVGTATTNDVRYQNPNPATPSCKINSITKDAAGNLSVIASQNVNIDWTIPSSVAVNDGIALDIDTTFSTTQLSANWTLSADVNSGIAKYYYAIGTTAGAADVVGWTDNSISTSVTHTGLSLTPGQYYFISVKSGDGAGLISNPISSDGQLVLMSTGINDISNEISLIAYPNPFNETATVIYNLQNASTVELMLVDVLGKQIIVQPKEMVQSGKHELIINKGELNLATGVYILRLTTNNKSVFTKLTVQ